MSNEELAVKIKDGEIGLIEELWKQVQLFIRKEANRWERAFDGRNGFTADDMVQSTYPAFLKTIEYFDPSNEKGGKFLTALRFFMLKSFAETAEVFTAKQKKSPLNGSTSLDAPVSTDADNTLADIIKDTTAEQAFRAVEDQIAHEQICSSLYPLLNMLTSEEQEIIFAHYWEGLSFEEIGKRGGVSRQRVHQIESKALNKLRRIPAVKQLRYFLDKV